MNGPLTRIARTCLGLAILASAVVGATLAAPSRHAAAGACRPEQCAVALTRTIYLDPDRLELDGANFTPRGRVYLYLENLTERRIIAWRYGAGADAAGTFHVTFHLDICDYDWSGDTMQAWAYDVSAHRWVSTTARTGPGDVCIQ